MASQARVTNSLSSLHFCDNHALISSQCSWITIAKVLSTAAIPATAAATVAGTPKITAPTAAIARPTSLIISPTIFQPFFHISTNAETAVTRPPMTNITPPKGVVKNEVIAVPIDLITSHIVLR
jgi:hypothetical protein